MQRNSNEFELKEHPFFNLNALPDTVISAQLDITLKTEESKG